MTTTISKKTILVSVVICVLLSLLLVANAYAVSVSANIKKGQGPVFSGEMTANYGVSYSGNNSDKSGSVLYFSIEERSGLFWVTDTVNPMGIGQPASGKSKLRTPRYWRVKLNPAYANRDCIGNGSATELP
jgi:hypothetical protein